MARKARSGACREEGRVSKSLAGKLGIPGTGERTYVEVDEYRIARPGGVSDFEPGRVHWADGRAWPIARVVNRREFGSRGAGNLVIRWTVLIGARTKTLWWEAGRWFVVAKGRGPRP